RPLVSRPCRKRGRSFPSNGPCFRGTIKGKTKGRTDDVKEQKRKRPGQRRKDWTEPCEIKESRKTVVFRLSFSTYRRHGEGSTPVASTLELAANKQTAMLSTRSYFIKKKRHSQRAVSSCLLRASSTMHIVMIVKAINAINGIVMKPSQ